MRLGLGLTVAAAEMEILSSSEKAWACAIVHMVLLLLGGLIRYISWLELTSSVVALCVFRIYFPSFCACTDLSAALTLLHGHIRQKGKNAAAVSQSHAGAKMLQAATPTPAPQWFWEVLRVISLLSVLVEVTLRAATR